jgi:hypothetical protein
VSRTTLELATDAEDLIRALNACETDEEAIALLDEQLALEAALEDKLERIHAVHRRAKAERTLLRAEEERLAARRHRCDQAADRVEATALLALETHRHLTGASKVVTPRLTARLQRSPVRLVVPGDPSAYPDAYIVQRPELDRAALKADLEAGAEVPGCALVRGDHVRWS